MTPTPSNDETEAMSELPEDIPEDVRKLAREAVGTIDGLGYAKVHEQRIIEAIMLDRRSRDATAEKMAEALRNIQVRLSESSLKPSHEVPSIIIWCDDEARLALSEYEALTGSEG